MEFPVLSALIVAPLLAAIVVALIPSKRAELHLPVGIALSTIPLAIAGWLFVEFEKSAGFQFTELVPIYEGWGLSWHLGTDGISMPLVLLTTILVPISLAASGAITDRTKLFVAMVLLLEAGTIGVFLALDLIVFFVFFELVLVPMYFIIGIWGSENRIYAAVKFFLYTAFGSALMLAGIIALGLGHLQATGGQLSFDYVRILELGVSSGSQMWLFVVFALAFAIKVPVFPLHTWLPDAHVQAPTAGSVLLAGVLLKMGTYGFLRFNLPLFPQASVDAVPVLAVLAVIGVVYGAAVAIVQPDLKKLVAYSSVSHLGFIVLGTFALTSQGLEGAVIQGINHGLSTGALFLLVGMLYERRHTKQIADLGGIAKAAPLMAGFFLFMSFASIGLPGLNGFVGEFLILIGSYATLPWFAIISASGVILAAIYLLWAYQRVFTGEPEGENAAVEDVKGVEVATLGVLGVLILVLGLYPQVLLEKITPTTDAIIEHVESFSDYEAPEVLIIETGGDHG